MRSIASASEQVLDGIIVVLIIAAVMGLWQDCALAQEELPALPDVSLRCAPELTANRRTPMTHAGVDGFWVHGTIMRCMTSRLGTLPLYADRVRLLEQRVAIGEERTGLLRRHVAMAEEGEQRAVAVVTVAERRAREAQEALDAWYRAPALWFALGGVVIAALAILGGWALAQLGAALP